MAKLFTIAGTSELNGETTFRFATGKVGVRRSVLKCNGHTNILLAELPNAMTKVDAMEYLSFLGVSAVLPKGKGKTKLTEEQKKAAAEAKKREERNAKKRAARAKKKADKAAYDAVDRLADGTAVDPVVAEEEAKG